MGPRDGQNLREHTRIGSSKALLLDGAALDAVDAQATLRCLRTARATLRCLR